MSNLTLEAVKELIRKLEEADPLGAFSRAHECSLHLSDVITEGQVFVIDTPDFLDREIVDHHDRRQVYMHRDTYRLLVSFLASQVPETLPVIPSDRAIASICAYYAELKWKEGNRSEPHFWKTIDWSQAFRKSGGGLDPNPKS